MMNRRVAANLVPPWLEPMLTTRFFSICREHAEAARSECNMFCLDCPDSGGFCFYCRSETHADHQVIQIRRSSYHDVVRVTEIQRELDIGGVQTYVINSARVLFLNERPQPRASGKGASPHACEICARSLLDPFRFCSLGCKLAGIQRNGDTSFVLGENAGGSGGGGGGGSGGGEGSSGGGGGEVTGGLEGRSTGSHDIRLPTPPPPTASHNSRRRKGTPHRAPFSS